MDLYGYYSVSYPGLTYWWILPRNRFILTLAALASTAIGRIVRLQSVYRGELLREPAPPESNLKWRCLSHVCQEAQASFQSRIIVST